tara:strand:+ start:3834 stop:6857 length:3024 start_codon:yes stop_codon:yes gene_type:complete
MNDENNKFTNLFNSKKLFFEKILLRTIKSLHYKKSLELFSQNDLKICMTNISSIQKLIDGCNNINDLQQINNKISAIFKDYGTEKLHDLTTVCYGANVFQDCSKFDFLCDYFLPLNYCVVKMTEKFNNESLDCIDIENIESSKNALLLKVHGLRVCFQDKKEKKCIIVSGILHDIPPIILNSPFISNKLNEFKTIHTNLLSNSSFSLFCDSLSLKELLLFSPEENHDLYIKYMNMSKYITSSPVMKIIKEYSSSNIIHQRLITIALLIDYYNAENQYLAYLLFDLLSNDDTKQIDSKKQTQLYDSLPHEIKIIFKNSIKNTLTRIDELSQIDDTKIPLEQQICLLKTSDSVKEKAMQKLKEIKSKSEDSGAKSRQYLDGLLKIPFSIFKDTKLLKLYKYNIKNFKEFVEYLRGNDKDFLKDLFISNITCCEIYDNIKYIEQYLCNKINKDIFNNENKSKILQYAKKFLNNISSDKTIKLSKQHVIQNICTNDELKLDFFKNCPFIFSTEKKYLYEITNSCKDIQDDISSISNNLELAIHGHQTAKRQIERIIAQWISGNNQGYCLGFEGPPGIGKTSFAKKGIANCLKDENDCPRPFAFIALGGSSNASTIDGHNYTYVGSTWGKIVDILIDSKCMNPIIFIDELDKVSKSEQGKEIIGVLTHLTDYTQNDAFQDKYFSGINLDLSKVLFIFSYNDVNNIDKILLDRIHRIKFDYMTIDDKVIIVKKFIFPELCERVGLMNKISIDDDVIIFIIDTYTSEPGVRKLKELFFEIIGEINVIALKNEKHLSFPYIITIDDVNNIFLLNHNKINKVVIHDKPTIGLINGMWANSSAQGGILPIQVSYFPSNTSYDFKLTGMQGDVMKESMNVAKSLAFKLLQDIDNINYSDDLCKKAIHVHCPDGATPKDGPSAGTAITLAIYSLLANKKIINDIAITGEITLFGNITQIGGLDLKILGAYKAGVKTVFFPEENKYDFDKLIEKHAYVLNTMVFVPCKNIYDIISKVIYY